MPLPPCDADLAVVDAHVHLQPGLADWLLVKGGVVVAVGAGSPDCAAPDTLALHGATVFPGFLDLHAHPAEGGRELRMLDLAAVTTLDGLTAAVADWARAHPDDAWIEGAGWDAAALDGLRPLAALDAVTTRPVFLSSSDGHSAFVNTAALRAAHLDPAHPPAGGHVDGGPDAPTGWIRETATDVVAGAIPRWSPARTDDAVAAGLALFAAQGITTIVDANADGDTLASYVRLDDRGALPARVFAAVEVDPGDSLAAARRLRRRYHSPHLSVAQVKLYLDGVVESGTASLLDPYVDGHDEPLAFADADLDRILRAADRAGFQVHVHAIGDGAVHQLLDAYARTGLHPARPPLAAHLELVDAADVPRFASLGVVADIQSLWAWPDPFVRNLTFPVVGPTRSARLYPFGDLHRAGATVVGGSDWSVTTMDPWPAIEVALTRRDPDAVDASGAPLAPDQALDLPTMLDAYTRVAGTVLPTDLRLGTLVPGAVADFVVLDRDPTAIPAAELSEVKVVQTWMGGRRVYTRSPG